MRILYSTNTSKCVEREDKKSNNTYVSAGLYYDAGEQGVVVRGKRLRTVCLVSFYLQLRTTEPMLKPPQPPLMIMMIALRAMSHFTKTSTGLTGIEDSWKIEFK